MSLVDIGRFSFPPITPTPPLSKAESRFQVAGFGGGGKVRAINKEI